MPGDRRHAAPRRRRQRGPDRLGAHRRARRATDSLPALGQRRRDLLRRRASYRGIAYFSAPLRARGRARRRRRDHRVRHDDRAGARSRCRAITSSSARRGPTGSRDIVEVYELSNDTDGHGDRPRPLDAGVERAAAARRHELPRRRRATSPPTSMRARDGRVELARAVRAGREADQLHLRARRARLSARASRSIGRTRVLEVLRRGAGGAGARRVAALAGQRDAPRGAPSSASSRRMRRRASACASTCRPPRRRAVDRASSRSPIVVALAMIARARGSRYRRGARSRAASRRAAPTSADVARRARSPRSTRGTTRSDRVARATRTYAARARGAQGAARRRACRRSAAPA